MMAVVPASSLKGRLLVAAPGLVDPNFDRTVVLLLSHGEEGALGVVLNRPSGVDVLDPLPAWSRLVATPSVVFVGGPVQQDAVIGLGQARGEPLADLWTEVSGRVGVIDLSRDPDEVGGHLDEVRLFSGYAGWDQGQLEGEIDAGGWFVVDAEPEDALSREPDGLWRRVLARQPGQLALYANYPADPSNN